MSAVWLFWCLPLALASFASSQTTPYNYTIRIDCGGPSNFTNQFNQIWVADCFFTGGFSAEVSEPHIFPYAQEKTLRFFPVSQGKKNCYVVNLPNGRYYFRMFFVYDNYDKDNRPPSFDVSIEGTVVFSWGSESWTEENKRIGAYSDLLAFIEDDDATVCFYGIGTDSPIIGALEIVQVDPECYNGSNQAVVLVNYGRFTGGNESFGAGLSNDTDLAGRAWESDTDYSHSFASKVVISTEHSILSANRPPNYFPIRLYQTAHTLAFQDTLEYLLPVDPTLDYMLWFHFAEIDPRITGAAQRVFDILVNDFVVFDNVDIFRAVGKYAAYVMQYPARNLTKSTLSIKLRAAIGVPMISGLENYAVLQKDISTDPAEVIVMRALKQSLQIPERMGWNGDPCAPSNWVSWEGVSCYLGEDDRSLVISRLDLSSQGLKGFLSEEITALTQLLSLNLSNNNIEGSIPQGLGGNRLENLDLSFNELSGSIPTSLGSRSLRTVILNGNQLDGAVPEALYSIGVTGGYVNLSDNQALCGVPSLPDCSLFWKSNHFSIGAKLGIAFGVIAGVLIIILILYLVLQRKTFDDYNFGLPHKLAINSTRYHKQSRLRFEADDTQFVRPTPTKFSVLSNLNL